MTDQSELKDRKDAKALFQEAFESLSKGWVALLAAIYGIGYVVVSVYHASLGLNEINPLRPRVAASGLLFLILISGAWFLMVYIRPAAVERADGLGHVHKHWFILFFGGLFLYLFDIMTFWTLGPILRPEGSQFHSNLFAVSVLIIIAILSLSRVGQHGKAIQRWQAHWTFVVFCALAILYLVLLSIPYWGQFGIRQFALFIFFTQFMSMPIVKLIINPQERSGQNWSKILGLMLLPLVVYSAFVYPHLRSAYGGGDSASAQIFLAPTMGSQATQHLVGKIIDETDVGFYVIPNGDKRVQYIPRSQVSSVIFDAPKTFF
jgi:hypothetical protein